MERIITMHEKQAILNKMNMVIGAFFSEVGSGLIKRLVAFETGSRINRSGLLVDGGWDDKKFESCTKSLAAYKLELDSRNSDIGELKKFLAGRKEFLLGLLGNQNLLEHESFTELLWSVFHLTEELEFRADVSRLSEKDLAHLSGDMNRTISALMREWVAYIWHLKNAYPYLFSLAVRTNPFNPAAKAEIE